MLKLGKTRRLPTFLGTLSMVMLVAGLSEAKTPKTDAAQAAGKAADKAGKAAAKGGKAEGGALPDAFAQTGTPAPDAASQKSFEELLKDAVPVKDFATLVEPLYARCDDPDPIYKRQCEVSKTFLLEYLRSHTFVAESDMAPDTSPYDAAAKQVDMEVPGCVYCKDAPKVAGEVEDFGRGGMWYAFGSERAR